MPSVSSALRPASAHVASAKVLGIGFSYISTLPADLYQPALVDFVEITPEMLCRTQRDGAVQSMNLVPDKLDQARAVCGELPTVVHGVELSIGSALHWNDSYLDMLDRFQAIWPFYWHSEHLTYQTIPGGDQTTLSIGVPLPLPGTIEAVNLVKARATAIRCRYGVPFLLENPAHFLTGLAYEAEIGDEIGLMTAITEHGDCGQLLDLHNLYCNAVNHGFDAFAAIERMKLDRVIEVHVAGGRWEDGYWMDTHDGCVPAPVWDLLEYTLPRCPNIAGVVFELLNYYATKMTVDAIAGQLMRARQIWRCDRRLNGAKEEYVAMPLLEYQLVLGQCLRASGADPTGSLGVLQESALDRTELAELYELVHSPGFRITKRGQRSWCEGRAAKMAELTFSILATEQRRQLINEWVDAGGGAAFDPASEADAFLEFVASRLSDPSHAMTVCRMEQAIYRAGEAALRFRVPNPSALDHPDTVLCAGKSAAQAEARHQRNHLLAALRSEGGMN